MKVQGTGLSAQLLRGLRRSITSVRPARNIADLCHNSQKGIGVCSVGESWGGGQKFIKMEIMEKCENHLKQGKEISCAHQESPKKRKNRVEEIFKGY